MNYVVQLSNGWTVFVNTSSFLEASRIADRMYPDRHSFGFPSGLYMRQSLYFKEK